MTTDQYTTLLDRLDAILAHLEEQKAHRTRQADHATRQQHNRVRERIQGLQDVFWPTIQQEGPLELSRAAEMLSSLWEISLDNARQTIKRYADRAGLQLEMVPAGARYLYYLSLSGSTIGGTLPPLEGSEPRPPTPDPITTRNHSEISALLRAGLKRGDAPL